MSEQCNNEHQHEEHSSCGCGCESHHHHHHHHHDEDHCGCGCHCTEKFLEIADLAWMEVLKDKIKAQILAHKGEHMDKLAELIAKANGERWKNKISSKTKGNEFKDELKDFFSSCE